MTDSTRRRGGRRGAAVLLATLLAAGGCSDGPDALGDAPRPPTPAAASPAPRPAQTPTQPGPAPTPTRPGPSPTPTVAEPAPAPACDDPLGCYGEPRLAGAFDVEAVPEASGLAASRRTAGVLYLLDDRPGTGAVWAIRDDGTMLGAVEVAGLDARDTESLAVGPCGAERSEPCVYVGDIGDNTRSRDDVAVHRFPEPDLGPGMPDGPVEAEVARWVYPDGPHDAEALLVDDHGTVFIVTKAPFDRETGGTGEARLYRAPGFADGELEDLGVVPVPEPAQPLQSLFVGNVVTGGDYLDGRVLLRTYDQVLEYVAPDGGADLATFPQWSVRSVPAAVEAQSEAIAWAPGGADPQAEACGYYTAGELVGDLWFVPCAP